MGYLIFLLYPIHILRSAIVGSVTRLVNGLDIDSLNLSMKKGIEAACTVDGVTRISAGNYGGNLGKYQIHLRELFFVIKKSKNS